MPGTRPPCGGGEVIAMRRFGEILALGALLAVIGGAFLAAAPALASNAGTTVRITAPLVDAGLTLTCGTTVLTATGGTAALVYHESTDAQGIFHVTGTGTLNRATLQDAAGNRYSVTGANWFGGSAYDPD